MMIGNKHKVLSVVLCLALVVCTFFALSVTAQAASGDTIYVRLNNGWSQVYCYMWNSGSNENAAWPGVKMTATSESGVFTYRLTGDYANIIFNNGSGGSGNQTNDLVYTGNGGDGKIYDLSAGSWSQYVAPTTGASSATTATQATTPSGDGMTVYLKNSAGWSTPTCYMWNGSGGSGNENHGWPGVAMTSAGDDVWYYTTSTVYSKCIFSNGGNNQTTDLTAQHGYIFDNQTNSWSVYDTSPLQVKEYTADPAANIYTGMEVALFATAVSSEGTVNYRFSVNGAVIRDFSSDNTAAWTPTAAGTYTVTFDFADTNGNENQRTLSLTVLSDANVTKPIIKKVTPSDSSYIKTGTASTVSVTAGGGVTGTNLLFYKYVIEDPDGGKNTPYYTLNSTYNFTPTKNGAYKVTVYVQASDNSTVSKTVTVNAAGTIPTTSPTTQPTTVKPTTQPTTVKPTTQPTTAAPTTLPTTIPPTTVPPTTSGGSTTYVLGDVNRDGRVSVQDATYMQLYLAEYEGFDVPLELGDMNGDGRIAIRDITMLQYTLAEFY